MGLVGSFGQSWIPTALLLAGSGSAAWAQHTECLLDKPFTATAVGTQEGQSESFRIGRASNGSYFEDRFRSGVLMDRQIKDVPNRRYVWILFQRHAYAGHSVALPEVNFKAYTPAEWAEREHALRFGLHSPYQDLGTREEAGWKLFGRSTTYDGDTTETWEAEGLGATYALTALRSGVLFWTYRLTDIKQAEPDSALFQIPEGFTQLRERGAPEPSH